MKLPTGYPPPRGTFFVDDDGEERIGGQATLGDGQVDITQALMAGVYIPPSKTFVRVEGGLAYRFGDPGHMFTGDLRVGQSINDNLIAIVGLTGEHTVTEGEIIGETVVARDPTVPNDEFTPDNLRFDDLRLDRSQLAVMGGVLFDFGDIEFTTNYYYTAAGRNVAGVHSFTVGTILTLPEITTDEE